MRPPPGAGDEAARGRRLARRAAWRERPRKICGQKDTPTADGGTYSSRPRPGYFAAFFLRSAQEAVIRSETAFFSSAVIGRRFLVGLASDAVSATGVAAAAGRREEERRAAGFAGAEVPRILWTSFNAWISPGKRSISVALHRRQCEAVDCRRSRVFLPSRPRRGGLAAPAAGGRGELQAALPRGLSLSC